MIERARAARYFAEHAPDAVRWAITGINRQRLEALRVQLGGSAATVDVLIADGRDQALGRCNRFTHPRNAEP